MSRAYTKNFFSQFFDFVKYVRQTDSCNDDIKLLSEDLTTYMMNGKWVKKEVEWHIFEDYNKLKDTEIAEKNNLTISNYRVLLNRLTVRLNSQLFMGNTLEEVAKDKEKIQEAIKVIEYSFLDIDVKEEFRGVKLPKGRREINSDIESKVYTLFAYLNSKQGKHIKKLFDKAKLKGYIDDINTEHKEEYIDVMQMYKGVQDLQQAVEITVDFITK